LWGRHQDGAQRPTHHSPITADYDSRANAAHPSGMKLERFPDGAPESLEDAVREYKAQRLVDGEDSVTQMLRGAMDGDMIAGFEARKWFSEMKNAERMVDATKPCTKERREAMRQYLEVLGVQ
jgi:hypothetical protein